MFFLHHTVGLTMIPNSCSCLLPLCCLLFSVLTPRLPPGDSSLVLAALLTNRRLIVGVGCFAHHPATHRWCWLLCSSPGDSSLVLAALLITRRLIVGVGCFAPATAL